MPSVYDIPDSELLNRVAKRGTVMTLDEWRKQYIDAGFDFPSLHYGVIKDAWDAANRAARKECSEICERVLHELPIPHDKDAEHAIMWCRSAIRETFK